MIPRLKPRPSSGRTSQIENVFDEKNISAGMQSGATGTSDSSICEYTGRSGLSHHFINTSNDESALSKENVQIFKKSREKQELSPSRSTSVDQLPVLNSPIPNSYENQDKHFLLNYSSSASNFLESDNKNPSYSDFSLTPPSAGSRPPLLVSAKRHGSEVRRQHNKRRRLRRRPNSTRSDSKKKSLLSGDPVDLSRACEGDDSDALCLWKGDSLSENEDSYLPMLASSDEECEETDRIEEIVRAEHLKEALIAKGNEKLQIHHMPFSANRAPPPKGCFSNPRPKRPIGHATRYKTPPKPSDDPDELSESNIRRSRKVQFGIPSAVEYEIDRPPGHLTPMSQDVTRKRYSMDPKEPTRDEYEVTQETKQNNLILSEWEDGFPNMRSNRDRSSDRSRSGSSSKRKRRNRRSSSLFSPGSRVSLAYDGANLPNSFMKEDNDPFLNIFKPVLNKNKSMKGTHTDLVAKTTPISAAKPSDQDRTWDFLASLGSINSNGAMELSPRSSSPKRIESIHGSGANATTDEINPITSKENTPAPTDLKILRIKAGHVAENESLNHVSNFSNENSNPKSSPFFGGEINYNGSYKTISQKLIESPVVDQEWDFLSLIRNLSSFWNRDDAIQKCLELLDPCIHACLSCTDDFVKSVKKKMLSTQSFPEKTSSKKYDASVESEIMAEWMSIEISFIENLTMILDQFRIGVESSSEVKNMDMYLRRASYSSCNSQPRKEEIEKEISKLECDIHRHESSLDLVEASVAPYSCILCQATARIGLHGFHFEEFRDDHVLVLDYMHAIFGAKTRIIVDCNSKRGLSIDHVDSTFNTERNSEYIFHRDYINILKSGEISIQLNCTDLQETLLRLSRIFGKLDQCTMVLKAISEGENVTIETDLPHVRFMIPSTDTIVSFALNLECFEALSTSVSKVDGSDFECKKAEIFSPVDFCDLEALRRIISLFT